MCHLMNYFLGFYVQGQWYNSGTVDGCTTQPGLNWSVEGYAGIR